jgi:hypothetical protein
VTEGRSEELMIVLPKSLAALATLFLTMCATDIARADRIILTPSPYTLSDGAASAETIRGVGNDPHNFTFANFGSQALELEIAEFNKPTADAGAVSVQTQFLPETAGLPAISFGIRDIGDNTSRFGSGSYAGRSVYVVGGRTPIEFAASSFPFRNLTYTVGLGIGGLKGPFGSVGGDLPLNMRYALEWDTQRFNEHVVLPLTASSQIEFDRLGAANYVGVQLHTPVTMF